MVRNTKTLDIRGRSLKLNTAVDVIPLLEGFDPALIEEVHLGGNTIGIEAAQEFANFLEKTQILKVLSLTIHFILVLDCEPGCGLCRYLHRSSHL